MVREALKCQKRLLQRAGDLFALTIGMLAIVAVGWILLGTATVIIGVCYHLIGGHPITWNGAQSDSIVHKSLAILFGLLAAVAGGLYLLWVRRHLKKQAQALHMLRRKNKDLSDSAK